MNSLKEILENKKTCKSIWFMRQAGRYLPEFRKIRSVNKDFMKLCFNSDLSSEITLQPIKRFDLDSAIIFSDILTVPYALGQNINFSKNYGPILSNFDKRQFFKNNKRMFLQKLNPVYKAIEITRKKLDKKKSLIAFVGAPWTLLVYMLGIRTNKKGLDLSKLRDPNIEVNEVLEELINYLCFHIEKQINAGADVVQIFDSWAGLIPQRKLDEYCFIPNLKIVKFCKKKKIPTICFPKGIKSYYANFNKVVRPDGINLDSQVNPEWARQNLKNVVIQGGLDPNILLKSENEIYKRATKYIQIFKHIPYVFNLGHGLLPETDVDKVEKLIKFYRNFDG